jgi:transposase
MQLRLAASGVVAMHASWAARECLAVGRVVTEAGPALNGRRRKFLAVLRDEPVTVIGAEHTGTVRFGSEYAGAALSAPWCRACCGGGRRGCAVKVHQAYRFALDPSPAQERALRSHAGAARFAWNWGLARCKERYEAEGKWYSAVDLHKLCNAEKKADPALAWWRENSKCAYQEAFRDLDRALRNFTASRKGDRKGRRLGFPRFKKRGRCKEAFRFSGVLRCCGATVTLPRLGTVRTHESTRKLARRLERGTARILSATVSRTAQRWFVSFTVEVERAVPRCHARPGSAIGIDLGVKTLLTGVDETGTVVTVDGPKAPL